MRKLSIFLLFLLVWIEISLFIQITHAIGVVLTMLLAIFTSFIGISLVKNQGIKNFTLMQQKIIVGESPALEMVKSVSLIISGFLLLLPGFLTDFTGLALLLPPIQKNLMLKLIPYLHMRRGKSSPSQDGQVFDGEFQRRDVERIQQNDRQDH